MIAMMMERSVSQASGAQRLNFMPAGSWTGAGPLLEQLVDRIFRFAAWQFLHGDLKNLP
jgi:hypothetical protein